MARWAEVRRRDLRVFLLFDAIEIPFVFNTINVKVSEDLIGSGPDAEALSEKVMDSWIAFAHTGNPNHDVPN